MDFWPSSWKDASVVWWVTIIVTVVLSLVLAVVLARLLASSMRSAKQQTQAYRQVNEWYQLTKSQLTVANLREQFLKDGHRRKYCETNAGTIETL